ncbi:MAG TPA: sulfotransferase family 2 domain-containing protein [Denitromonas sp.]|nr:sulfotransferase family 2 domain-containing protein [Denitromonas sp.]
MNGKEFVRDFDPEKPLIFLHIPKTAGISCRQIFEGWYGGNLLLHYFDEVTGSMPEVHDLSRGSVGGESVVVYGHFNRVRGFGVEEYYPEVNQFVTIVRDPFDRAVSTYFYLRKMAADYKDKSNLPGGGLREYISGLKPTMTMLNFFPRQVTMDNYKDLIEEYFVDIGVFEYLNDSIRRIAGKLRKPFEPTRMPKLNVSDKDQWVPGDLRDEFMEGRLLEYAVYDYVKEMHRS